ncbi:hypothetical protein [Parasedimentitalea denitrificans]|uniref:hypothetical protein n=1 Tax=Parasedimentitalea denitrificans TaxID=2211118 RepID=UPI0014320F85|nr:hypothetical protein [Sedimentitalea sp. CY04]
MVWACDGPPPQADPTKLVVIVQTIERDAGRRALGWLGASGQGWEELTEALPPDGDPT